MTSKTETPAPMAHPFGDPDTLLRDRAEEAQQQLEAEMPQLANAFGPMVLSTRLQEAAHIISRDFLVPAYARLGLKPSEFDVLTALMRSGAPYTLTPTELQRMTMVSSGSVTARLDRLERSGFVERKTDPQDRRSLSVELTPNGLNLIREALPESIYALREAASGLNHAEQDQLSELLGKLLRAANAQKLP